MFHIVGYHLPAAVLHSVQGGAEVAKLFTNDETETVEGFDERLYRRSKDKIQRYNTIGWRRLR